MIRTIVEVTEITAYRRHSEDWSQCHEGFLEDVTIKLIFED